MARRVALVLAAAAGIVALIAAFAVNTPSRRETLRGPDFFIAETHDTEDPPSPTIPHKPVAPPAPAAPPGPQAAEQPGSKYPQLPKLGPPLTLLGEGQTFANTEVEVYPSPKESSVLVTTQARRDHPDDPSAPKTALALVDIATGAVEWRTDVAAAVGFEEASFDLNALTEPHDPPNGLVVIAVVEDKPPEQGRRYRTAMAVLSMADGQVLDSLIFDPGNPAEHEVFFVGMLKGVVVFQQDEEVWGVDVNNLSGGELWRGASPSYAESWILGDCCVRLAESFADVTTGKALPFGADEGFDWSTEFGPESEDEDAWFAAPDEGQAVFRARRPDPWDAPVTVFIQRIDPATGREMWARPVIGEFAMYWWESTVFRVQDHQGNTSTYSAISGELLWTAPRDGSNLRWEATRDWLVDAYIAHDTINAISVKSSKTGMTQLRLTDVQGLKNMYADKSTVYVQDGSTLSAYGLSTPDATEPLWQLDIGPQGTMLRLNGTLFVLEAGADGEETWRPLIP
ncbi:MAG: hypothetical protein LBJ08_09165 [Bifidobacteriaceae bacterium]|jgi:hypothetical protein|nr:hypothetical protein [Bifidobacteriaceae bacterium]